MTVVDALTGLPPGRLLSLDLGQVRIGVAICDESMLLARPLTVIKRRSTRAEDHREIQRIAERERAVGVLVGLPDDDITEDAEGSPQARWVRRYAGRLSGSLDVPLALWNETLSTVDAREMQADRNSAAGIDSVAAAVILLSYLEARRSFEGQGM